MRGGLWASVRPMHRMVSVALSLSGALLIAATSASAQQGADEAQAGPATLIIQTPQPSAAPPPWFEQELEDASMRIQRTRNALIGTSVGLAVGIILAGAAVSQCESVPDLQGNDEYRCNNAGDALLTTGGTIAGLSIIGMITSGAMLGVAKRNKRQLQRDLRRGYYGGRLRWDVPKGALLF